MAPNTTVTELLGVDYARISDDDTGLRAGVDDQAAQNLDLAERRGITLVGRFCDNSKSASRNLIKRSDFQALLDRIKQGDVRYVIGWHPDRLLRDNGEGVAFVKLCEQHKVTVVTVTAGDFDLSTAWGAKSFYDAVNMAAYESKHRGERVKAARARQAERGDYGGGVRPYGWGLVTDKIKRVQVAQRDPETGDVLRDDRGKVIREYVDKPYIDMTQHNPAEAAEIRRMAQQILNGVSIAHMIKDLKARNVRTVTGGAWGNRQIRSILTSPRVSGHAVYHGEIVQHDAWEPILSEDQRQALITILSDPARKTSPGNQPKWLGSLIYQCGYCGENPMSVRKTSDGLPVYRCRVHLHGSRDAVALDQYVTDVLLHVLKRDAADLVEQPVGVDVAALTSERERLRGKLRELTDMFMDELITREQLTHQTAKATQRIDSITAELSAEASTSPIADFVDVDDVRAVWDAKSIGEQREILKIVLKVTVKRGSVRQIDEEHVEIVRA